MNIQNLLFLVNSMNCPKCDTHGQYHFKVTKRLGLVYYISFICQCGNIIRLITGNRIVPSSNSQMTDLNMTSILAGSLLGVHRRGLQKFFGAMGILPPVQIESYKRYENLLSESVRVLAEKSKEVAANEVRNYYHSDDVAVSIDGTWMTQGHSSLHGIGTILSIANPPKVLDYELLSRRCGQCDGLLAVRKFDGELYNELLEQHLKCGCEANYDGSSGGMEGAAVKKKNYFADFSSFFSRWLQCLVDLLRNIVFVIQLILQMVILGMILVFLSQNPMVIYILNVNNA